jgi:hypothetical protein
MFKISRDLIMLQFHLEKSLMFGENNIKKGFNLMKKNNGFYDIYHSDNFEKPYTQVLFKDISALKSYIFKGFVKTGWFELDEDVDNVVIKEIN